MRLHTMCGICGDDEQACIAPKRTSKVWDCDILLRNKGPEVIEKSRRRTVKRSVMIEVFPYVPVNRSH
jgi:hypothetical protein